MKAADDAHVLDTTGLDLAAVVARIEREILDEPESDPS